MLNSATPSPEAAEPGYAAPDLPEEKSRAWAWRQSKGVKVGVGLALVFAVASPWIFKKGDKGPAWGPGQTPPVTASVTSAPFLQEVVERGEIESSSNVELRCGVQSRGSQGTAIIQIVPEGIYANKGDFLVKLDDSALRADLLQQQIACNTSRAQVTEAKAAVESARLALQEYESGTFRQEEQAMESDQFVAKENLRRAEEYLRYSEGLAARGYVTEVQLEADRFSVEKSRKELDSANTKLEVLHRLTKQKTLNKLKADVEIAEALLRSRENSHELDNEKLKEVQTQIENCVIRAPTSGQVVYGKDQRNNESGEPAIAEGKLVRERQVIIRLPDPKRMKVLARINESRIDRVKIGMHAKVRVDAFPSLEMEGTVREVSEYPLPNMYSYSTIKEYAAEIEIHEPPEGLRVGMTARVAIEVQKLDSALQVPLPAVIQRDNRYFCIVAIEGNRLEAREVAVGLSNDKSVIIERGLNAGEPVLLAPQNYEEFVSLPAAAPKPRGRAAASATSTSSPEPDEPRESKGGKANVKSAGKPAKSKP
jgi:RND family efflux transporter MFP subunit